MDLLSMTLNHLRVKGRMWVKSNESGKWYSVPFDKDEWLRSRGLLY